MGWRGGGGGHARGHLLAASHVDTLKHTNLHTQTHKLAHSDTQTCFSLSVAVTFGLQRSVCGRRKRDYLKRRAVCSKRIALLNNSQALMNVAGDVWGETNSNCHIMKSTQCLVSKETLN